MTEIVNFTKWPTQNSDQVGFRLKLSALLALHFYNWSQFAHNKFNNFSPKTELHMQCVSELCSSTLNKCFSRMWSPLTLIREILRSSPRARPGKNPKHRNICKWCNAALWIFPWNAPGNGLLDFPKIHGKLIRDLSGVERVSDTKLIVYII